MSASHCTLDSGVADDGVDYHDEDDYNGDGLCYDNNYCNDHEDDVDDNVDEDYDDDNL